MSFYVNDENSSVYVNKVRAICITDVLNDRNYMASVKTADARVPTGNPI